MGNKKTYNWCLDYGNKNETAPKFTFPLNFMYFTKIKIQANETQVYITSEMN